MGYYLAGFDVFGVDVVHQPNFPWPNRFVVQDVRTLDPTWIAQNFQVVTGSPPCQAHTVLNHGVRHRRRGAPPVDLIPDVRALVRATGLPYVIENVPGAPLENPVMICGSGLGLRVRRHRLFESNIDIVGVNCNHEWQDAYPIYPRKVRRAGSSDRVLMWTGAMPVFGTSCQLDGGGDRLAASVAMGISWMTRLELAQAIPPMYTQYLGLQIRKVL